MNCPLCRSQLEYSNFYAGFACKKTLENNYARHEPEFILYFDHSYRGHNQYSSMSFYIDNFYVHSGVVSETYSITRIFRQRETGSKGYEAIHETPHFIDFYAFDSANGIRNKIKLLLTFT